MKKVMNVLSVVFITLLLYVASSCYLFEADSDIIEEKTQEVIKYLEENNKEGIKKLFAKTKIENIENFDSSLEQLIEYYDGTFVSKNKWASGEFGDKDGKFSTRWFLPSVDVTTSVDTYRIAFYYCSEYTTDKNSIGIWSLYIIKISDDLDPKCAYRGDGLWTPGINIGKVYIENK